jgi:hypothetical protein
MRTSSSHHRKRDHHHHEMANTSNSRSYSVAIKHVHVNATCGRSARRTNERDMMLYSAQQMLIYTMRGAALRAGCPCLGTEGQGCCTSTLLII